MKDQYLKYFITFIIVFYCNPVFAECDEAILYKSLDLFLTKPTEKKLEEDLTDKIKECDIKNLTVLKDISERIMSPMILSPDTPEKHQKPLKKINALIQQKTVVYHSREAVDVWKDRFQKHFYLGFEGTGVSGFKNKGTVRTGLLIYNIFYPQGKSKSQNQVNSNNSDSISSAPPDPSECYGTSEVHAFGNALLTSSAEITSTIEAETEADTDNKADDPKTTEVEPAFEGDINLFYVHLKCPKGSGRDQDFVLGPLLHYSLTKPDNSEQYAKKYYLGYRFSHGPEAFFDVVVGKSEGIKGLRLEFKAQTAVSELANGSVYIGAIANIGLRNNEDETDSLRLYATWHYDLNNWFDL